MKERLQGRGCEEEKKREISVVRKAIPGRFMEGAWPTPPSPPHPFLFLHNTLSFTTPSPSQHPLLHNTLLLLHNTLSFTTPSPSQHPLLHNTLSFTTPSSSQHPLLHNTLSFTTPSPGLEFFGCFCVHTFNFVINLPGVCGIRN